jgi:hypothetical protein
VKKLLLVLQWVVLLGFLGVVLYFAFKPRPPVVYDPAAWKSWDGFFVLSYAGITSDDDPAYVAPRRLEEQLRSLRDAGYQTIKLSDALAYLQGKAPLPDKALLLLFEGGRRDSFLRATPILEKLGFLGNMCIPTKTTRSWGTFFLNQGQIQKICQHPNWDLVSMGDQAIEHIAIDAEGDQGHFLSHRQWLGANSEDDEAFRRRLANDYLQATEFLTRACSRPVIAYLYAYADTGTGAGSDPMAADINRVAVEGSYLMAFTRADNPFNGPRSDRYALTRLRVRGDLDGPHLMSELAKYAPREQPVTGIGSRDSWQLVNGPQMEDGAIRLPVGSWAWLRGTDNWRNVDVQVRGKLGPGALALVYAREAGPEAYLRLAVTDQEVTLQERLGRTMQTLARQRLAKPLGPAFTMRLWVKGNRAWAWVNEVPVMQAAPLTPATAMGRVGVGAQEGQVLVEDVTATPLPDIFLFAESYRQLPPDLKEKTRALIPPWFPAPGPVQLEAQCRSEALQAAAGGVEIIPALAENPQFTSATPAGWAAEVATALNSLGLKALVTTLAVPYGYEPLTAALEREGFGTILVLPARQALQLKPEDLSQMRQPLLLDGPEIETRAALERLLHFVAANRLIIRLEKLGPVPPGVKIALNHQPPKERATP